MSLTRELISSKREVMDKEKTLASTWRLVDKGKEVLLVEETASNKDVHVSITGNLRSDAITFFKDELLALATVDGDVILDLEKLTNISNLCQKALIETQQLMDSLGRGTLTLVKVPSAILDDFKASGMTGVLMIE